MSTKKAANPLAGQHKWTILVLAAALIVFAALRFLVAGPAEQTQELTGDYAEYDNGVVTQILSDNTWQDGETENAWRGEQSLIVEVKTGQYKGESLLVDNYVGPLYGGPLKIGDRCTMIISTYADGSHRATVYEFDRMIPVAIVILLFFAVTVAVGGKTGAKSLIGLVFTVLCVFFLLFPALLKGAPTLPATFLLCVYVAAVSFFLLGGVCKKTLCALAGSALGMGFALAFALLSQAILRVDGLRTAEVEPLLQLQQTGTPLGLRGLLAAGVILASLGAVMDVAMSISSALQEVKAADPSIDRRGLLRSGMNIGRDMVGTMTNTLILAFLGSGLVLILYIYTIAPDPHQLISSPYVAIETVSGISCSIGVILSVPVTAAVCAAAYAKE